MARSRYVARSGGIALLTSAVFVGVMSACSRAPDPEVAARTSFVERIAIADDAGAVLHLTSSDELLFDEGWYPLETGKDGVHGEAWRWMGHSSMLRLRTHDVPMKLELTGSVPMHLLGSPPLITFRWKGLRVETFLAPGGRFTKTVAVTPPMQAGSTFADFTIETSSVGREGTDPRDLGFTLNEARWEAASR
jgi:hypothetical protein